MIYLELSFILNYLRLLTVLTSRSKLFERLSNKYLFIIAVVIFEGGSAICGAAPSLNVLIVGRVICGLGAFGMYIGSINILTVLTTIPERPIYIGLVGASYCLGTMQVNIL